MVLGALIDAGIFADSIRSALNSLDLPIQLEVEQVKRCGFVATKATIHATDQEDYRFLPEIEALLLKSSLTPKQLELARKIFHKVAVAEAAVHGMPLERVHFHEIGALDSIADILGAAVGLDLLGVELFSSSPVPTGTGTVKAAHGLMPVPTPGTLELLKGVPLASSKVEFELTTPTGAAILTSVASSYTASPEMIVERVGHGAGTKDFIDRPNILRLLIGTASVKDKALPAGETDTVAILETNLDDATPEMIGYCMELLFAAGALDVFSVPVLMKKSRPGTLLSVICDIEAISRMEEIIFRESGTFGIRRSEARRSKLQREFTTIETPLGPVKAKRGWRADGFEVLTPEYEDCARIAKHHGIPLREVFAAVRK
jgi:pyridinium-3,5-bisthiocarboxylic acid mononucleotide nickel chelatase